MAKQELIQTLSQLSKKIDSLLAELKKTQDKVEALEKANHELSLQHQEDLLKLNKAHKDIEFLTLSHRLASSPEALINARNTVSRMIKTIDSCIRMINED